MKLTYNSIQHPSIQHTSSHLAADSTVSTTRDTDTRDTPKLTIYINVIMFLRQDKFFVKLLCKIEASPSG